MRKNLKNSKKSKKSKKNRKNSKNLKSAIFCATLYIVIFRDSERFLEFDYGTDHAWAPLKGKCVELDESQYTYRLCLFDRAVQKERGGHSEVNLG